MKTQMIKNEKSLKIKQILITLTYWMDANRIDQDLKSIVDK